MDVFIYLESVNSNANFHIYKNNPEKQCNHLSNNYHHENEYQRKNIES